MIDISKIAARSWARSGIEVGTSSIHGLGVFTRLPVRESEVVIVWGGVVMTLEEFRSGAGLRHTNVGLDENLYLVSPSHEEMTVDDYMNHSCDPNLWLVDELTLVARRDISKNEELTIDYAIELLDESYVMKHECNCHASCCRKVVTGRDWQLKEVQNAHREHFSPFVNRRIEIYLKGQSHPTGEEADL